MKVKEDVLYADDGMILTDGVLFGKSVYLGAGADASAWREISEEEYEAAVQTEVEEF